MTATQTETLSPEVYRDLHAAMLPGLTSLTGNEFSSFRAAGLDQFLEKGFPTTHQEDWRFTSLRDLKALQPKWTDGSVDAAALQARLDSLPVSSPSHSRLVFVDGVYDDTCSTIHRQVEGVDLMPLSAAVRLGLIRVEEIGQYTCNSHSNSFVPLNDAFFQDGLFLRVAKGQEVNGPVEVHYIGSGLRGNVQFPRQVILMGEGAAATVIEQHHHLTDQIIFKNCVSEIFLGDQSRFECIKLQMEPENSQHIASYFIHAIKEADFRIHSFDIGGGVSRNSLKTVLNGPNIHGVLNGLYITRGTQLSDHHMIVEHNQPSCDSHEYFNGILDDKSRAVFHGRIYVDQKGQKTDAKQTNKNILLTDDVVVDTKPQLEIYADDVKCTHGATVGQLDDDAQFYLQARGIPKREAKKMLIHAFASEIVERVEHEAIREMVDKVVWDTLDELPSLK